jgi:hypothetical protein
MGLIRKIPRPAKRSSRWRCKAHENHVKSHECVSCTSQADIEGAHVRIGSHTGMGQKPHDWLMVPLCVRCHRTLPAAQHNDGEVTFWRKLGKDPFAIIEELIATSPKRAEIMIERASRP